jgi:copper chaperone NosL
MKKMNGLFLVAAALVMMMAIPAIADTVDLPDGAKLDLSVPCPVCNMKVGAGKLGPAAIVFKDGKVVGFDGSGDFFRYLLDPKKYGFDPANIKKVFVTRYGTKNFIDAKQAFFVMGSDMKGTMGPEAVAFAKKEDAQKFSSEHHGKKVAAFSEVKPDELRLAKKMLKMKMKMEHGH